MKNKEVLETLREYYEFLSIFHSPAVARAMALLKTAKRAKITPPKLRKLIKDEMRIL